MATFGKPRPAPAVPPDLLPVIRQSGVLTDKQFADVKDKVAGGDYPADPAALADRLVKENVLSDYQAKRFLANKSHGLVVGRYVILDRLGSGSMGRVYKAHHLMMDRLVAIKIIAPEIVSNERIIARFQREMKLVGRLDHPNVIRAFDADQVGKILYIVMEYVQGQSLAERMRKKSLSPAEVIDIGAQAALGLAHAHAQGIVHRDVKPSNLLLTDDRQVKVLDLGLGVLMEADNSTSFATADGITVGTIDYMSPEQACGREVDGRSDLFSLGCSMYHLMTGALPYPGESPIERMGRRIKNSPVPITQVRRDLPSALVRVLDKLLAHKPHERFQTAAEAAEALQALLRPRPRPPTPAAPNVEPVAEPKAEARVEAKPVPPPEASYEPIIIRITPEYPRWFRPLARLAESRPRAALAATILGLTAAFGVGALAAWLAGK